MGLTGVFVQAHPRMGLGVVISKFPSIGQTNPPERLDSRSPNTALQNHPGRVSPYVPIQVRLLSFSRMHVLSPLTHPTGGPGESGVNFTLTGASQLLNRLTGGHYDIVSWDPRGVGLNVSFHLPHRLRHLLYFSVQPRYDQLFKLS